MIWMIASLEYLANTIIRSGRHYSAWCMIGAVTLLDTLVCTGVNNDKQESVQVFIRTFFWFDSKRRGLGNGCI